MVKKDAPTSLNSRSSTKPPPHPNTATGFNRLIHSTGLMIQAPVGALVAAPVKKRFKFKRIPIQLFQLVPKRQRVIVLLAV